MMATIRDSKMSRVISACGAIFVLALALGIVFLNPIAAGAADRIAGGTSCGSGVVVDYSAPLRTLPPVKDPPGKGGLPFRGGAFLRLETSAPSVFSGRRTVGFWLTTEHKGDAKTTVATQAHTTVAMVSSSGERRGRVRIRVQDLAPLLNGRIEGILLAAMVGARPALYRADTYLLDRSGASLVHYAAYFRVLPSRLKVRLGVPDAPVSPEGVLRFRVENLGTIEVQYGYAFSVERRQGARWVRDPSSPRGFPLPSLNLPAGLAGVCQSFRVPAAMEPGRYRLTKRVETIAGNRRTLSASFSVSE